MSVVKVCGAPSAQGCEGGLQCLEGVRASDAPPFCFGGHMKFPTWACDHIQHAGPEQRSISEDVEFAVLLTVFLFLNDDLPVMLFSLLSNL